MNFLLFKLFWRGPSKHATDAQQVNHVLIDQIVDVFLIIHLAAISPFLSGKYSIVDHILSLDITVERCLY